MILNYISQFKFDLVLLYRTENLDLMLKHSSYIWNQHNSKLGRYLSRCDCETISASNFIFNKFIILGQFLTMFKHCYLSGCKNQPGNRMKKTESVNRERKYHQVDFLLTPIVCEVAQVTIRYLMFVFSIIISKTLLMSLMLFRHNGGSCA